MSSPELSSRHNSPHEALTIGANSLHLSNRHEHFAQRHEDMQDLAEYLREHGDWELGALAVRHAVDQSIVEAGESGPYAGRHRLEDATLGQVEGMVDMYDEAAQKTGEQRDAIMAEERSKLANLDDDGRRRLERSLHPDRVKLPRALRREQRRSGTSMAEWLGAGASPESYLTVVSASLEAARNYSGSREFRKVTKKATKRFYSGLERNTKQGTLHPSLLASARTYAADVSYHWPSGLDSLYLNKGNRGYALTRNNTVGLMDIDSTNTATHERLHLTGTLGEPMLSEAATEELTAIIEGGEPDTYPVERGMMRDLCAMADINDYELSGLYAYRTGPDAYADGRSNLDYFKERVEERVGWDIVGWAIEYRDYYKEELGEDAARAVAAMAVHTAKMVEGGATEAEIDDACNAIDGNNQVPELTRRIVQMQIIDSMLTQTPTDTAESEDYARAA